MTDTLTDSRPSQEMIVMTEPSDTNVESIPNKGLTLLQVLATSDGGEAAKTLNDAFRDLVNALVSLDMNEGVRKSKGALDVKMAVEYEDGTAKVKISHTLKTPKAPMRASVFWITQDGRLTPENPRQMNMPFGDVRRARPIIVE